eukprot:PhF_6_TR8761/c0_g1_i1/m.13840
MRSSRNLRNRRFAGCFGRNNSYDSVPCGYCLRNDRRASIPRSCFGCCHDSKVDGRMDGNYVCLRGANQNEPLPLLGSQKGIQLRLLRSGYGNVVKKTRAHPHSRSNH